jgi:hypothetical protein
MGQPGSGQEATVGRLLVVERGEHALIRQQRLQAVEPVRRAPPLDLAGQVMARVNRSQHQFAHAGGAVNCGNPVGINGADPALSGRVFELDELHCASPAAEVRAPAPTFGRRSGALSLMGFRF